jgi:glycosyltransferase involved in cell wall biosynthesis
MQNCSNKPRVRHIHTEIKRGGGGAGYLYNLKLAVDTSPNGSAPIEFDFRELRPPVRAKPSPIRYIRRRIGSFARWSGIRKERRSFGERFDQTVKTWKSAAEEEILSRENAEKMFECDLLFVHHIMIADCLTRWLPTTSRQKLIVMAHAPTFTSHQIASDLEPMADTRLLYEERRVQSAVDREVEIMNSVRAVAWPCPEAQEGYLGWKDRRHTETEEIFIETGVARPLVTKSSEKQRSEWGITPDKRIALFLGRPHPHKGFCRFLEWAKFNKQRMRKDWVFVFGGEKPAMHRDVSALRYVGYIHDNGSAYSAADLVLVPNKYSYLDIGLLEMLSLGAKAAISPTGGHRHVQEVCPSLAIIPEGDVESSWNALERAAERYVTNPQATQDLAKAWETRFSLIPFKLNHMSAIQGLL